MSCTPSNYFPANYALPPVVTEDKWQGFAGSLLEDGEEPPVACTGMVFQIHTSQAALDNVFELTSAASEITLDLTTWEFTVLPAVMTLAAGTYFWAIAYLDGDGDPITVGWGPFTVNPKGIA